MTYDLWNILHSHDAVNYKRMCATCGGYFLVGYHAKNANAYKCDECEEIEKNKVVECVSLEQELEKDDYEDEEDVEDYDDDDIENSNRGWF